jgi:hypothetical protein
MSAVWCVCGCVAEFWGLCKAQGTEGTVVSCMVVAFFAVEERESGRAGEIFDGVFGDVLVTLWDALVMCWVCSRGDVGQTKMGGHWLASGKARCSHV